MDISNYKSAALPTELCRLLLWKSTQTPLSPICFSTVLFGGDVKAESTTKYWEKTRLNNLVRHTNGRYYARLYLNGKEKWQSLKTSHFSVAEAKLKELQKEHREHRGKDLDPRSSKMTFGQAATLHMKRLEERVTI